MSKVQGGVPKDDQIKQGEVAGEREHGLGRRRHRQPVRDVDRESFRVPGHHQPGSSTGRGALPECGEHRVGNESRLPPAVELGRCEAAEGRGRWQHESPRRHLREQVLAGGRRQVQPAARGGTSLVGARQPRCGCKFRLATTAGCADGRRSTASVRTCGRRPLRRRGCGQRPPPETVQLRHRIAGFRGLGLPQGHSCVRQVTELQDLVAGVEVCADVLHVVGVLEGIDDAASASSAASASTSTVQSGTKETSAES